MWLNVLNAHWESFYETEAYLYSSKHAVLNNVKNKSFWLIQGLFCQTESIFFFGKLTNENWSTCKHDFLRILTKLKMNIHAYMNLTSTDIDAS